MSKWGWAGVTHSVGTAGTVSTSILVPNADRTYALFINDSNASVYLACGGAAALNTGIRLNADGGNYEMARGAGNVYGGSLTAISVAGTAKILITEAT